MGRCHVLLAGVCLVAMVTGHGRLRSPRGRSSMWRDGFRAPKNYRDNELNCGGRNIQWEVNGGKCGACGDPYNKAQENQPPGKYARPIIAKCYNYRRTKYIDAHVQLTANHLGFMEFRLCPNNDFSKPVTQKCLDENLLTVRNEHEKYVGKMLRLTGDMNEIFVKLEIPANLTCSQCVLQWKYVTGNSWGCVVRSGAYKCGMGRGPQESFWNCADIAIKPDCDGDQDESISDESANNLAENKAKISGKQRIIVDEGVSLYATIDRQMSENKLSAPQSAAGAESKTSDSQTGAGDTQSKTYDKESKDGNSQSKGSKSQTLGDASKPQPNTGDSKSKKEEKSGSPSQDEVNKVLPDGNQSPREKQADQSENVSQTSSMEVAPTEQVTTTDADDPDDADDANDEDGDDEEEEQVESPLPKRLYCTAVGFWATRPNMHSWCLRNCIVGFCPEFLCFCQDTPF